jgi:hypothetical protein
MAGVEPSRPTATQVFEPEHETPDKEFRPVGVACETQLIPSVVFTMVELPTAVHSESDTHEIDCT